MVKDELGLHYHNLVSQLGKVRQLEGQPSNEYVDKFDRLVREFSLEDASMVKAMLVNSLNKPTRDGLNE
jgi:hypothetical protein